MIYGMNSQEAQDSVCTYFHLLIVYQVEMNEEAEEPRGKVRITVVIYHT